MSTHSSQALEGDRLTLYLSQDAASQALGSEEVAAALLAAAARKGLKLNLIRTGSRGMIWLEPLAEIEIDGVRHAFGPLEPADANSLLDCLHHADAPGGMMGMESRSERPSLSSSAPQPSNLLSPSQSARTSDEASTALKTYAKALGPTEDLDWMKRQTRLTFARVGLNDPFDLTAYRASGGLAGWQAAQYLSDAQITQLVKDSGLRGRGGAGFPTGIKWETVRSAVAAKKYIVCNADEGDSGTFADRMLMEGDPFCLIEGMMIAARAVGASIGYIYIRSEYPHAIRAMQRAIGICQTAGLLDQESFDIEVRVGAGAYVCGEETALLNSLEGKRGVVRAKPPLPALQGAFGAPTVVNNVISLASVPWILANGAEAYRSFGLGRSRGTMPLQIAGNVKRGGLFEAGFGLTLGEIVNDLAGGTATGRPVKAVQAGGPLGAYLPPSAFDTPIGYEEFASIGGLIGHAGFVIFDDSADMLAQARFAMEFCAIESCGKCTPCRIGAVRGVETLDRIRGGETAAIALVEDLCAVMKSGSLCALGGFTPYPVLSALQHWPDDFAPQHVQEAAE